MRAISRANPTLEDVFLAATRRSWDADRQAMKHFLTILSHEIRMLLVSPSTYIAAVIFLALMGFVFTDILDTYSQAPQDSSPADVFFKQFWLPVLFMVPLLTMKCLAEERRLGTIETLLTTPVTTTEVVLGKYGAAYALYAALWGSTGGFFCILRKFAGDARLLDLGPDDRGLRLHRRVGPALHRDRGPGERPCPQPGGRGHPLLRDAVRPDLRRARTWRRRLAQQRPSPSRAGPPSVTPRCSATTRISRAGWSTCASCCFT